MEPSRRYYRPKGWAHVDPAQLVEWFDGEPLFGLAAALVVSSTEHRPWNGAPRQLDDDFLRSGWFECVCKGLELNPGLWRRMLRERSREIENRKRRVPAELTISTCDSCGDLACETTMQSQNS